MIRRENVVRLVSSGAACGLCLALAATVVLVGCGARSSVDEGQSGAQTTSGGGAGSGGGGASNGGASNGGASVGGAGGGTTATTTSSSSSSGTGGCPGAECDDGIACTVDSCGADGCEHVADDSKCGDGIACTVDVCGPSGCEHVADDLKCDDGFACTADFCGPAGCKHVSNNALCDDGVVCTIDKCSSATGCSNVLSNAACEDGLVCTIDTCDFATDTCQHASCDSVCDDGIFCNGVERCDTTLGCTSGALACTLGLGCETSSCAEAGDKCSHTLPAGCTPPDVHLLVSDPLGNLWDVAPYQNPSATLIAAGIGITHLDVAILNGRWFAMDFDLVELAPGTNQVIASLGQVFANSLAGGPDGKLYAVSQDIYRVDPDTGAQETIGTLPPGYSSSGDVAFLGERMFVSTDSNCGGALVEFDIATGKSTVLGGDGLGCVYGLASGGDELFILNCDGKVGAFDPDTGQARVFATTTIEVFGADRLP